MTLLFGLLMLTPLQSDVAAAAPKAIPHNFLKGAEARRRCAPSATGEIVVCGRAESQEDFRLRPLPNAEAYREQVVRAEATVLGDGKLSLHNEDAVVGGFRSKTGYGDAVAPVLKRAAPVAPPIARSYVSSRTTGARMTTFDDRESAFENKFAHDEAMAFRISARRNRIAAAWAADKMGLDAEEAEAYAGALIEADFEEAGDEDVVRKLVRDLAAAAVEVSEADIRAALATAATDARRQLTE